MLRERWWKDPNGCGFPFFSCPRKLSFTPLTGTRVLSFSPSDRKAKLYDISLTLTQFLSSWKLTLTAALLTVSFALQKFSELLWWYTTATISAQQIDPSEASFLVGPYLVWQWNHWLWKPIAPSVISLTTNFISSLITALSVFHCLCVYLIKIFHLWSTHVVFSITNTAFYTGKLTLNFRSNSKSGSCP